MFKKIQENETIQIIRELLKNPRYSALAKLLLWGIFFLVVFGLFNSRGTSEKTYVKEEPTSMTNYQFTITINNEKQIKGSRVDEIETYTENGIQYQIQKDELYQVVNGNLVSSTPNNSELDIRKLRPEQLKKLATQGEQEYKTEYKDKTIQTSYTIPVSKFASYYNNTTKNKGNITMVTYEKNSQIIKIELDLTSFKNQTYKITITYNR